MRLPPIISTGAYAIFSFPTQLCNLIDHSSYINGMFH